MRSGHSAENGTTLEEKAISSNPCCCRSYFEQPIRALLAVERSGDIAKESRGRSNWVDRPCYDCVHEQLQDTMS